jgi:hypothetical protein
VAHGPVLITRKVSGRWPRELDEIMKYLTP